MKAAVIEASGATPVYRTFPNPGTERRIGVTAAALSHVTRSRASGKHYSASDSRDFVPGVDGVGKRDDGRRVYFLLPEAPYGSFAEWSVAPPEHCLPLPDAVDDVTAAAIAIPGMSSWAALTERARFAAGGTVLVNGATGISGGMAVQIAKRLGAAKVIATGRNCDSLARLRSSGADVTIPLTQERETLDHRFEALFEDGVDVVLDYLWGSSAECILVAAARAAPEAVPIRYVQIGSSGGADITLPSAVLRSSSLELLGSGLNSIPFERLRKAIGEVFAAAAATPFDVPVQAVPLHRIGEYWDRPEATPRTVFTM